MIFGDFFGAGGRTRTGDLLITNYSFCNKYPSIMYHNFDILALF